MRRFPPLVVLGALVAILGWAGPAAAATQPMTWNAAQIGVAVAHGSGYFGRGVTVAVVDGYVDPTHPEFSTVAGRPESGSRVLAGADCRSGVCVPGQGAADDCGHGTHVAGIVASATYGVAPQATVLPIRALSEAADGSCSGSPQAVAGGINWAVAHGAQIVNLSLGDAGGTDLQGPDVRAAVHGAASHGVLVVVAAGNQSRSTDVPNYGPDALVVAATGPDNALASYSDFGPDVTLAAPGGDNQGQLCNPSDCIASTWLDHRYALLAGTSMAAPEVAGTAALLISAMPGISRPTLVSALEQGAHPLVGTRYGRIDVAASVKLLAIPHSTPSVGGSRVSAAGGTPALQTPPSNAAITTVTSPGSDTGPRGPWQIALLLLVVVSALLGAVSWSAQQSDD
ncbi:MAG TPA: S8 family serine peptidase [Mycobacteriales bacterium]|nr:S8 family serine peptidase [Mycobacteriales bacterium]